MSPSMSAGVSSMALLLASSLLAKHVFAVVGHVGGMVAERCAPEREETVVELEEIRTSDAPAQHAESIRDTGDDGAMGSVDRTTYRRGNNHRPRPN
jgi:hypothetical protein